MSDTEFTVSDDVAISVYPGNQPPVVDAGADQSIVTGPATLSGTISDDGLPTGGGLTSSWSKASGPGSVTFGNSNSLVTTVSFSEAGFYILRLSASDSQFSRFDEVTVTVTGNQPPIVDAGADQVLDLVTASGATFSTVTYPPNPDAWRTEPSQPGLTGVWGNIGSATRVERHSLSWSGSDLYVGGGFQFANGVAMTPDEQAVFVCETGAYRIVRVAVTGAARGSVTPVLEGLPGFPDNISRGLDGRYWVALFAPRNALLDALSARPFLRKVIVRIPMALRPRAAEYGHIFAMDAGGRVLDDRQDPSGGFPKMTDVLETERWLFIGSLQGGTLARVAR